MTSPILRSFSCNWVGWFGGICFELCIEIMDFFYKARLAEERMNESMGTSGG